MAKMSFARKKGILSDQSDAIKQHFYFSRMRKSHFLFAKLFRSFSLALFFFPLPFFYIDGLVAHFIVLLLQGILAG